MLGLAIVELFPLLHEKKIYHDPIKMFNVDYYSDQILSVSGTASAVTSPMTFIKIK